MLSLVTAAEQQYRHESSVRDREHRLLVSIRDRHAGRALLDVQAPLVTAQPERAAWARPIGARLATVDPCPAGCAVA